MKQQQTNSRQMSNELCTTYTWSDHTVLRCVCSVRSFRSLQKSMQIVFVCAQEEWNAIALTLSNRARCCSSPALICFAQCSLQLKLRKNVRD